MKQQLRILIISLLFVCFLQSSSWAVAIPTTDFSFSPGRADMYDFSHSRYYTWGIRWTPVQPITYAELVIKDINNWKKETNVLFMHLLDRTRPGMRSYRDNQSQQYDNFLRWRGGNIFLDAYVDDDGGRGGDIETYKYVFTRSDLNALNRFAADGRFGFGFDPDCHFWNNGVELNLSTNAVPEPATMVLMGTGLLGLALRKRKSSL